MIKVWLLLLAEVIERAIQGDFAVDDRTLKVRNIQLWIVRSETVIISLIYQFNQLGEVKTDKFLSHSIKNQHSIILTRLHPEKKSF